MGRSALFLLAATGLVVTDERVLALISRRPDPNGYHPVDSYEIWHAEIPEGGTLATGTSQ